MNAITSNPGAPLEQLVAYIEAELAGPDVIVTTNERRFNSNGRPIAEFDIIVRGKIGSADFAWLIECRDRQEKAGVDWIRQLPTKRHDHAFDKVTAVSTSGFTEAAMECARVNNIDLRVVSDMPSPDNLCWLRIPSVIYSHQTTGVRSIQVVLDESSDNLEAAADVALKQMAADSAIFKHNDQLMTCDELFLACVRKRWSLFDDVTPNGPDKIVNLEVTFDPPTALKLVTRDGDASIARIVFWGELRHQRGDALLQHAKAYSNANNDERISESVKFLIPQPGRDSVTVEAHTFALSGKTQFVLMRDPGSQAGSNQHRSGPMASKSDELE